MAARRSDFANFGARDLNALRRKIAIRWPLVFSSVLGAGVGDLRRTYTDVIRLEALLGEKAENGAFIRLRLAENDREIVARFLVADGPTRVIRLNGYVQQGLSR